MFLSNEFLCLIYFFTFAPRNTGNQTVLFILSVQCKCFLNYKGDIQDDNVPSSFLWSKQTNLYKYLWVFFCLGYRVYGKVSDVDFFTRSSLRIFNKDSLINSIAILNFLILFLFTKSIYFIWVKKKEMYFFYDPMHLPL